MNTKLTKEADKSFVVEGDTRPATSTQVFLGFAVSTIEC